MSAARDAFIARIDGYKSALASPGLTSSTLTPGTTVDSSSLLRNGLIVVGYAILEDFLRTRTAETLERLSTSQLRFDELPDQLQAATTMKSIEALAFRASRERDPVARLALLRNAASDVSSAEGRGYSLSPLGLASRGSNLSPADVSDILTAFALKGGWRLVQDLAARIGGASIDVNRSMTEAFTARNLAAHQADAATQASDLESFRKNAIAIAIAFDALLSRASKRLLTARHGRALKKQPMDAPDIGLRFLEPAGVGLWRERSGARLRAAPGVPPTPDLNSLRAAALKRASTRGEVVVERGGDGIPVRWSASDMP
jgi:hypothetical protein